VKRNILRGWDARAILLGLLAFGVMQGLASGLMVVTLLLFGHSPHSTANTTASVLLLAFGQASYFLGGVVAGWLASNRSTAHGALLGSICVFAFMAMAVALFPIFKDRYPPLPELTGGSVLSYLMQTVLPIALAMLGGWLGGKRHRALAP